MILTVAKLREALDQLNDDLIVVIPIDEENYVTPSSLYAATLAPDDGPMIEVLIIEADAAKGQDEADWWKN